MINRMVNEKKVNMVVYCPSYDRVRLVFAEGLVPGQMMEPNEYLNSPHKQMRETLNYMSCKKLSIPFTP